MSDDVLDLHSGNNCECPAGTAVTLVLDREQLFPFERSLFLAIAIIEFVTITTLFGVAF